MGGVEAAGGAPGFRLPAAGPGKAGAAPGASREEQAKEAGRQFEEMFVRLILTEVRKAASEANLGGEEEPAGGFIYDGMADEALASAVVAKGGLGLGDVIAEQVRGRVAAPGAGPAREGAA
ncbi:MAG TPA: hypothetical protein VHF22_12280 [Planctomycetota bacterium]|nr:hypothetical protein [Planctomycetota bacterium]